MSRLTAMTMPAADEWLCSWCGFPFLPGEVAQVSEEGETYCGPSCHRHDMDAERRKAARRADRLEVARQRAMFPSFWVGA